MIDPHEMTHRTFHGNHPVFVRTNNQGAVTLRLRIVQLQLTVHALYFREEYRTYLARKLCYVALFVISRIVGYPMSREITAIHKLENLAPIFLWYIQPTHGGVKKVSTGIYLPKLLFLFLCSG